MKRQRNSSILDYFNKSPGTSLKSSQSSDDGTPAKKLRDATSQVQNKTAEVVVVDEKNSNGVKRVSLFSSKSPIASPKQQEQISPKSRKEKAEQATPKSASAFKKKSTVSTPTSCTKAASFSTPKSSKSNRKAKDGDSPETTPSLKSVKQSRSERGQGDGEDLDDEEGPKDLKHLSDPDFSFAKPERIKDAMGRRPDHPEFDHRTLFVPEYFLAKQTPGHKQWWSFKAQYFDTVLFFKVGKFYELYHWDAVVGVEECGLAFMSGNYAHAGFPEHALDKFKQLFLQAGYKVARIEQTETNEARTQRIAESKGKRGVKADPNVRREICRIDTSATVERDEHEQFSESSNFILAVCEKQQDSQLNPEFGICFVDCSTSLVKLGQFNDDRNLSRLRTLVSCFPPQSILIDRKSISKPVKHALSCLSAVQLDCVPFKAATASLKSLKEREYFNDATSGSWPEALDRMLDESDLLKQSVKYEFELAVKSFGAIVDELHRCLVDQEILSLKLIEQYNPFDSEAPVNHSTVSLKKRPKYMVLDSITLSNLDILKCDGGYHGSLFETINHCSTRFGQRLLRQWICAPLCDPEAINARLDAVDDLTNFVKIKGSTVALLKDLPDLEQQLSVIHKQGHARRSSEHPESRAVMFCQADINKKKIVAFIKVIDGFRKAVNLVQEMAKDVKTFKSDLLKRILTLSTSGGSFPDIASMVAKFEASFDRDVAQSEGKIIPNAGVVVAYDRAVEEVDNIEQELNEHLKEQETLFRAKCRYYSQGKNRFMLEVPIDSAKRYETSKHDLRNATKTVRRYYTDEIRESLQKLLPAEERRAAVLNDIMRQLFESFSKHFTEWLNAVKCLAIFDCLLSLATYRNCIIGECCRPEVVDSDEPFLDIVEGCHPILLKHGDNYIPNDVSLKSQLILLTGPNMGGKSTLMRQTGLLVLLAQMGSYVPAFTCSLSPCDRIFTRLGASDRLVEGESTFFVECNETATILHHATKSSLVLLDELGRGTATYDGTAIAYAVAEQLSLRAQCRTLFSTHYHSLVEAFAGNGNVTSCHMACLVDNENIDDPTKETITFLYKLVPGDCPKSYGFNAAKLAHVPDHVVKRGYDKAHQVERQVTKLRTVQRLKKGADTLSVDEMKCLLKGLRALAC
ncbi:DNA mismatch repair protein Msh6 [Halotydeus destructor]|nr:DNA mismatch repair protein Msh6 [Halotydeus destructor]